MLKVGDKAPDFRVELPGGVQTTLADHAGRPVVLIFMRHLA